MKRIELPGGGSIPAMGQGTWMMGEGGRDRRQEIEALRAGIDRGMTLIDTAEMYGDGASEELVGEAVAGRRDEVFIVSKVLPGNASVAGTRRACEDSLKRLRTDRIDLYLLHWRGGLPLARTVEAFEILKSEGKILRWGVSNFDVADLEDLERVADIRCCAVNQVLYNPEHRGIEFDLIPWQRRAGMPVMAYSPVGQGGHLLRSKALAVVAKRHGATPAQVAISWAMREGDVVAIPKAGDPAHAIENADAAGLLLSPEDLAEIDAAHPPPGAKQRLAML